MIFVGWVRPFTSNALNTLELVNSAVTLCVGYFLIIFTDFLPNSQVRYSSAWALIAIVVAMIVVNIAVQLKLSAKEIYKALR